MIQHHTRCGLQSSLIIEKFIVAACRNGQAVIILNKSTEAIFFFKYEN